MKKIFYATMCILSLILLIDFYLPVDSNNELDSEYAMMSFTNNIDTKEYNFEKFNSLYLFNNRDPITDFSKKTKFINEIPNLKIVNSEDYKVVISTNTDALNKLKINISKDGLFSNEGSTLVITFLDNCYKPVHIDDNSYDYDTGLYVNVSKFEIIIYAPIYNFRSDTSIKFEYEAPISKSMSVHLDDTNINGIIKNIETDNFVFFCSGTSNIELSGKVNENAKITIFHNTKVNAKKLLMNKKDISVSSALIPNVSYVKCESITYFEEISIYFIVKIVLHLSPIIWLILLIRLFRKSNKNLKNI